MGGTAAGFAVTGISVLAVAFTSTGGGGGRDGATGIAVAAAER
jgi:hypothetical protein